MILFSKDRLQTLFSRFSEQSLLVIGDMMVDHYVWGNVARISPEAPVPVVNVESESFRLGGAANVASNVMTLGARPIPVGVVGNDHAGQMLKQLFSEKGIRVEGIVTDKARQTTLKTRIIAHHQHVVRTDREDRFGISASIQRRIENFVRAQLPFVKGSWCQNSSIPSLKWRKKRGSQSLSIPNLSIFLNTKGFGYSSPIEKKQESDWECIWIQKRHCIKRSRNYSKNWPVMQCSLPWVRKA